MLSLRILMDIYDKFAKAVIDSEKEIIGAEHLVNFVLPVVKDSKILLRVLEQINKVIVLTISNILKFEHLYKRVELSKDSKKNLDIFMRKCSGKYGLNEKDSEVINEILFLGKKHKESGFEFSKSGRIIILDDELKTNELSLGKIREFIIVAKKLNNNSREKFKG